MKTIWFDITNTPQVHFLSAIYDELKKDPKYAFLFSAREFSETTQLLREKIGNDFVVFGGHYGKSYIRKILGLFKRFQSVLFSDLRYDISISCGSENAIWTSYLKRKKSIAFGDNDLARQYTYGRFVDYAFFPDAIAPDVLTRQGIKKQKLFLYPGYKEDVYLANFQPDPEFRKRIPFDEYVVVRPENIMANYIRNENANTITPALLALLVKKGYNVLYLPRYKSDKDFAEGLPNVFIPPAPINGLDACYNSLAVLTGAGTFAREAACLGIPSFSFFAGSELMAVDKKMIKEEKMFFSRNPDEILERMKSFPKTEPDLDRSKRVKKQIMEKLGEILSL
ncbi:MAG: DUF354 domain-containing protein [Bacteroidales bacterium]